MLHAATIGPHDRVKPDKPPYRGPVIALRHTRVPACRLTTLLRLSDCHAATCDHVEMQNNTS